jgi:hypothetical protein
MENLEKLRYTPNTVITISDSFHIEIPKNDSLDFIRANEIDRVLAVRGGHSSVILGLSDSTDFESGEPYQYDAWSPLKKVGRVHGENLDLLIASKIRRWLNLEDDTKLNELIEDAAMDEAVEEYLRLIINHPEHPNHAS